MPRKPRVEIAGYYHVINRGVEQRVVFEEKEDYEKFEELLVLKHNGNVDGAKFSKDENEILSWSSDNTVKLWDK
jgi:WD40 repeat protein